MSKIVKKKHLDVLIESTLEKAGIKKQLKENNSYFRFDATKGPWYDVADYSYDELPEGDYEDLEYQNYDDFNKDYPEHKHFMGHQNAEGSRKLFDRYKSQFGPLKSKRLKSVEPQMNMESKKETKKVISESKELINEDLKRDLARFNKLSNYTYKK